MTERVMAVGIDPGTSGGVVRFGPSLISPGSASSWSLEMFKMPADPERLLERLLQWQLWAEDGRNGFRLVVMVEKVGGFMGNEAGDSGPKHNRASAHTMFTFGYGAGVIKGMLMALDIEHHLVPPQAWQAGVGMKRFKGETKGAWKKRLLARAKNLIPHEPFQEKAGITLSTSDAALIAYHCRRTFDPAFKRRTDAKATKP